MKLDPLLISRLQFAFTIKFQIIFPTFTIGVSAYVATLHVRLLWPGGHKDRFSLPSAT